MRFNKEFLPYLIIIIIAFVVIVTFFYLTFFNRQPSSTAKPSTSPTKVLPSKTPEIIDTPNLEYHPDTDTKVQFIDEDFQKTLAKDSAIGTLISKLPYQGTLFSLEYSYQTNSFTLNLKSSSLNQANSEFEEFLKSNQIQNRNWLYNLKTNNL
jgi:hypothetical protein